MFCDSNQFGTSANGMPSQPSSLNLLPISFTLTTVAKEGLLVDDLTVGKLLAIWLGMTLLIAQAAILAVAVGATLWVVGGLVF